VAHAYISHVVTLCLTCIRRRDAVVQGNAVITPSIDSAPTSNLAAGTRSAPTAISAYDEFDWTTLPMDVGSTTELLAHAPHGCTLAPKGHALQSVGVGSRVFVKWPAGWSAGVVFSVDMPRGRGRRNDIETSLEKKATALVAWTSEKRAGSLVGAKSRGELRDAFSFERSAIALTERSGYGVECDGGWVMLLPPK
jgi:hypothetical protein